MRFTRLTALLPLLAAAVAASAGHAAGTGNTWTAAAPLPSGRWNAVAAASDGKIFLLGGFGCATNDCTSVDAYDPAHNSWTSVGEQPESLIGPLSATTGPDGRIYISGFADSGGSGDPTGSGATMLAYDPRANSWSREPAPPGVDDSAQLVTGADGRIYAVGGRVSGTDVGALSVFDPRSHAWTALQPFSTPRGSAGVAAGPDGRIYVIGGLSLTGVTNRVDAYDPKTNTWSSVAPLRTARAELRAITGPDGRIYAIGGGVGSRCFTSPCNVVEAYEVKSNRWTVVAPVPHPRWLFAAAVGPDERIYILGGSNAVAYAPPDALVTAVDAYTVVPADQPLPSAPPGPTSVTRTLKPMPTGRENLGAAMSGHTIYAIGGQRVPAGSPPLPGRTLRTVEAYDVSKGTWAAAPPLPAPRQGMGVAAGPDGRIYMFGGIPTMWDESAMNLGGLRSVLVYDPRTRRWNAGKPMPDGRYGVAAVRGRDGRIYLIGGVTHCDTGDEGQCYGDRAVRSYDPRTGAWKTLAPLQTGRLSPAAAVGTDGRIFVFGGDTLTGPPSARFEIYDPRKNRWSWGPEAPHLRTGSFAAATAATGHVDLIGGCLVRDVSAGGYSATCMPPSPVDSYDPRSNRWTTLGMTLNVRQGLAAVAGSDGRVYAVGGAGDGNGRMLEVVKAGSGNGRR